MRYDFILDKLTPGALYKFDTKDQEIISRIPGKDPFKKIEKEPILDSYEAIIWEDKNIDKPTLEECENEWLIMQRNEEIDIIREKRKNEYPNIGDQLDYIYHNGIDAWKNDIIKPVKDKYKI